MTQSVLILGANGKFGFHAACAFEAAGWNVHRFDRAKGDLAAAMQGKDVIVNAWNPVDYSKWSRELLDMHRRVLRAAQGTDATLILPGNVYVYGDQTGADWSAETPKNAVNELGEMRIAVETAYRDSGLRTIILRGGDYLDTRPSGNWFDRMMVTRLTRGVLNYPGQTDIPHAWAYLPDIARAAVALSEKRAELPVFCDVGFRGYTLSGEEMAVILGQITGQDVRAKQMSWLPFHVLGLVWPMMRELCKMQYLWDTPHALDGTALERLLPDFESTSPQEAFRCAIGHLVLPQRQVRTEVAPAQ